MDSDSIILGWREWLALPQLGIAAIKTKIDSGARTSSLRVETLEEYARDGQTWLRFTVAAGRRNATLVQCEAQAIDQRAVSDSGGHVTLRWFVRTEFELAGRRWPGEINLTDRRSMLFPLLLGRNALGGFIIDPDSGYRHGRPRVRRRKSP
jgi:hypothetical protein